MGSGLGWGGPAVLGEVHRGTMGDKSKNSKQSPEVYPSD